MKDQDDEPDQKPQTEPSAGTTAASPRRVLDLIHPAKVAEQTWRMLRFLGALTPATELDLGLLRRILWHAVVVGVAAGALGALFFGALELMQQLLLERLAGYVPLRAHGEPSWWPIEGHVFRPWVLVLLPAIGGVIAGGVIRFAPETAGGGTDAVIEAFHKGGGMIRRRVVGVKAIASLATLGFGGAGGREGPTMQIGAALGSALARLLGTSARERRVLLLAGVAAGIAAVFRTPLGAALLAVEVLYKDGIESEALVPCILASVVSYSVVISIYGQTTLLAPAARYPFVPAHLPLYALLAFLVSVVALGFSSALRAVRRLAARAAIPEWVRPGVGGLSVGVLAVVVISFVASESGARGYGLGILGGGYGAAQMAISGDTLLPEGWRGVEVLLFLCLAKSAASALTIGTGGSAGDFAPSLAIGGLFGGAFGRAAALLLDDPRIAPGAFALVGMGAFYGGIAHVPLAALVLVCELAGSYDLLVPLMFAEGVAFVILRKRSLYDAQVPMLRDSPVHRRHLGFPSLRAITVRDRLRRPNGWIHFDVGTRVDDMIRRASATEAQEVFPVLDRGGELKGLVSADVLRDLPIEKELKTWVVAADVMQRAVLVRPEDDLATAARAMLEQELRAVPVIEDGGRIVGYIDQADVARAYVEVDASADLDAKAPSEEDEMEAKANE